MDEFDRAHAFARSGYVLCGENILDPLEADPALEVIHCLSLK